MLRCAPAVHMHGLMITVRGPAVPELPPAPASDVGYAAALAISQQAVDLRLHTLTKVASCVGLLIFLTHTCDSRTTRRQAA